MIKRLPSEYDVDIPAIYGGSKSCIFRRGTDEFGAFGNMTGGYPLYYHGVLWKSSEALYQAARFPEHPEIQEAIRNATNGFTAKLVAKAKIHHTRPDWDDVRIAAMYYAIHCKIASNYRLWDILAATGDKDIVEYSTRDQFWGAKPANLDPLILKGNNALGKIWMFIRERNLPSRTTEHPPAGLLPGKEALGEFYD